MRRSVLLVGVFAMVFGLVAGLTSVREASAQTVDCRMDNYPALWYETNNTVTFQGIVKCDTSTWRVFQIDLYYYKRSVGQWRWADGKSYWSNARSETVSKQTASLCSNGASNHLYYVRVRVAEGSSALNWYSSYYTLWHYPCNVGT